MTNRVNVGNNFIDTNNFAFEVKLTLGFESTCLDG